jgi:hypothetical protein
MGCKDENEAIKTDKAPEVWERKPAKNAQRDEDARRIRTSIAGTS